MQANEVTTRHFAVATSKDGISALVIYSLGKQPVLDDIAELVDRWQRDALKGLNP